MTHHISRHGISIDSRLHEFIHSECLPHTAIEEDGFWLGFGTLIRDLAPRNARLLQRRDDLQAQIDAWHRVHPGPVTDVTRYFSFLESIGYIEPECPPFQIDTDNVDREIAKLAGPQLVVPVDNTRYALNAANARWGSLYDALYGTDVIAGADGVKHGSPYDPARGGKVIAWARAFLDAHFPLPAASHADVVRYRIADRRLLATLPDGVDVALSSPGALVGYRGPADGPHLLLLLHHGLHVELHFDHAHPIGRLDKAGISDIVLESALTTIQDCEDSVAAVDAKDKVRVYRNWLGLMTGTLTATFSKAGADVVRSLAPDRQYVDLDGQAFSLPGRALMLVRNVGSAMMTDSVLCDGADVPESIVDAVVTSLIAIHDLRRAGTFSNSRTGSIYIVKPKMHGPQEVAFADELFARVETLLGLPPLTIKMGIMDEERRTSVNLHQSIRAARHRCFFINTGFLDRSGDEIHTSMEAGPMVRKGDLRAAPWLAAYEQRNVDIGIAAGLPDRAQIGKGMWAMPDCMNEMFRAKSAHPKSGASTAWVPSPTAATLHAVHYHQVNVSAVQAELSSRPTAPLQSMLVPPIAGTRDFSPRDIEEELDNNIQGILGYVARWIQFGVGCSKVPDLHNVGLMEDRATLRISSQHVANWLHHGICSVEQVEQSLLKMARVVDQQNAAEAHYRPVGADPESSLSLLAARDLIFQGRAQPNGYTETILHRRRREQKAAHTGTVPQ